MLKRKTRGVRMDGYGLPVKMPWETALVNQGEIFSCSDYIESGINDIAAVSETSASNSEEVAAASEEQIAATEEIVSSAEKLSEYAEELKSAVNKFKI